MKLEGRFSLNKDDPGHQAFSALGARRFYITVKLDGQVVMAITADTGEGKVLVYARDEDGKRIIEGSNLKTEWLYGKVEVHMPEVAND